MVYVYKKTMQITSLSKTWGWPLGSFDIIGTGFGNVQGKATPYINRYYVHKPKVLFWSDTKITVEVPKVETGSYKVLVFFGEGPAGPSTVSKDFWIALGPPPPVRGADEYSTQVRAYKDIYKKSAEWEKFMLANKNRYINAFNISRTAPYVMDISFRYDTNPIKYNPPWKDENEHMAALKLVLYYSFPSYHLIMKFKGDEQSAYINMIAGIPTNDSFSSGKVIKMYYETIAVHEMGHSMGLGHHYDTDADTGLQKHMPPGETLCVMDRSLNQFCSACRMAIGLPLDVDYEDESVAAVDVIYKRYPY